MAPKNSHFINPKNQYYEHFNLILHQPANNQTDPCVMPWGEDKLKWLEREVEHLQYSKHSDVYIELFKKYNED